MTPLADIERRLDEVVAARASDAGPQELLALGEGVLEHWVSAKGLEPTNDVREGFRLLALHRQGAVGDPSFNACRETCRELVYHYNLLTMEPQHEHAPQRLQMMALVANHLRLFVVGKLQVAALGDFCCSARPAREAAVRVD